MSIKEIFQDLYLSKVNINHSLPPIFYLMCSGNLKMLRGINTLFNNFDTVPVKWKFLVMCLGGKKLYPYFPKKKFKAILKKLETHLFRYYNWTLSEIIKNKDILLSLPLGEFGFTSEEINEVKEFVKVIL